MKFQPLLLSCALMTLTACAQTGTVSRNAQASALNPCTVNGAEQELLISLSQEMVTEGRLHASLANLEQ